MKKTFKNLALGAAVAGLFAGAALVPGCGDNKSQNTESNGCGGPNGCGGTESNGSGGANGCGGADHEKKDEKKNS